MNRSCAIILATFICTAAATYTLHSHGTADPALPQLAEELRSGRITAVEILAINPARESLTAFGSETLRHHPDARLTITGPDTDNFRRELADELDAIKATTLSSGRDVRWGGLFRDAGGQEIGAIFVNHSGERGYLGQTGTRFAADTRRTNLATWLAARFPPHAR